MNARHEEPGVAPGAAIPNGAAAAAILSAGAGCFALGACAWLGDAFPVLARFFVFYGPTGPLSGVTTTGILVWLVLWGILSKAWRGRSLRMGMINSIAFLLLGLGVLLTFPPFGDLLQGK
jgi:hypothetical protein